MGIRSFFGKIIFQFLKLLSLTISTILGLFFNCSSDSGISTPEYGMPHADYKISGTVKSFDDNLPVRGLLVSIRDTAASSIVDDSTLTDSNGRYSLEFTSPPWKNTWNLIIKDIDSTMNGSHNSKDTVISIAGSELKGGDGKWKSGHGEKAVDLKIDKIN